MPSSVQPLALQQLSVDTAFTTDTDCLPLEQQSLAAEEKTKGFLSQAFTSIRHCFDRALRPIDNTYIQSLIKDTQALTAVLFPSVIGTLAAGKYYLDAVPESMSQSAAAELSPELFVHFSQMSDHVERAIAINSLWFYLFYAVSLGFCVFQGNKLVVNDSRIDTIVTAQRLGNASAIKDVFLRFADRLYLYQTSIAVLAAFLSHTYLWPAIVEQDELILSAFEKGWRPADMPSVIPQAFLAAAAAPLMCSADVLRRLRNVFRRSTPSPGGIDMEPQQLLEDDALSLRVSDSFTPYPGSDYEWNIDGNEMSIKKGELVLAFGAMGSGKSTFAKLLSGEFQVGKDVVEIDALRESLQSDEVQTLSSPYFALSHRGRICHVPQFMHFDTHLSPYEVVRFFARDETFSGLSEAEIESKICSSMGSFGLSRELLQKSDCIGLSGGQLQCLALIAGLVRNDDIYILDEPFKSVDYSQTNKILPFLQQLRRSGKTVIIISHAVQYVQQHFLGSVEDLRISSLISLDSAAEDGASSGTARLVSDPDSIESFLQGVIDSADDEILPNSSL